VFSNWDWLGHVDGDRKKEGLGFFWGYLSWLGDPSRMF